MDDDLPWQHYSKADLYGGLSYPVGRDHVEVALRTAEARISSLTFGLAPKSGTPIVIIATWPGISAAGSAGRSRSDANGYRPTIEVKAVPSAERAAIRDHLDRGGLDRVCRWIAEMTANSESAALISGRRLSLTWSGSELLESIWPPRTPGPH